MTTADDASALLPALDDDRLPRVIAALVFAASEPPTIMQIASALAVAPRAIDHALSAVSDRLNAVGLQLQRHGDELELVTASDVSTWVERFLNVDRPVRLSAAAIETLAVIAYRQPVTRAGIEGVRGVNSDRALTTLLARGLVEEVGRSAAVGHPSLFGTTDQFLNHFGLASLADLPPIVDCEPESPRLYVM